MENNEYSKLIDFLGRKFEEMDNRFEQMDNRFEQMDNRFEQMDNRFEQMDNRFERIDNRFEQMDSRFERIDNRFEQSDSRFDAIEKKMATKEDLESLERRTGVLLEAVDHKIDLVIEGQQGIIQKLNRHIEEDESEHKRLEHMIMEDRADIYNIKKRLS